jgi:hypothetical protein
MRKISLPLSISGAMLVASLLSSAAQAQATRTWVSGVGDDANPCSRTAPCKTFAGAISKTAPGGEIDALDPGGFGAVSITKAITIDGGGGQVASVLTAGSNGINVNAGAADVVTLRNLRIIEVGGGPALVSGISFLGGGALHVQDCYISGFAGNGISVTTGIANVSLFVNNTFLTNNGNGIQIAPSSGNVRSILVHVWAQDNSGAGFLLNPGAGIGAGTLVNESSAVGNGTGIGVNGGKLNVGNSVISKNNVGVAITGGTVLSYKTNMIDGNTTDGTPLTGTPLN